MKKILIIYGTAGEGHKRAAFAIKAAFDTLNVPDIQISVIDALDYTDKFFKWSYPRIYIFMVKYIPTIWGLCYFFLDMKWLYPFVKFIRRIGNSAHAKRFEEFLCESKPDVVIATHFLASEVISNMKRGGRIKTKLIVCVTDFGMHSFWFSNEADYFCAGFEETKTDIVKKWGVPEEKVNITGIPVHPKFYEAKNKDEICIKLHLSKDLCTVLIAGGGFGVGPIMALVKGLIKEGGNLQTLVVCGHNKKLKEDIDKLSAANLITYGFIDYVDELMNISDVAITKAGGLICSEALAKELPLIIIAPIPGQESRNSNLLVSNNAAFRIVNPGQLKKIIKKIYSDKNILQEVRRNIHRIRKSDPAANIARFSLTI